ncbi:uncharacterized protein [Aquarana catesbeiana]|uniref:uncharacterized protein n=1 Tax=Aquarana catesbeiana TaxID=8400 RepID=UPI003CC9D931
MCPGEKSQRWTPMIVLFLISFPFLCHSQTALEIMDSTSYIGALLGQNVTIPCVLTDKDQPEKDLNLNLVTDSVRWDMVSANGSEDNVYLFTNGRHTQYRQNSNVEGTGFKRGNASLTLYNVQQGDEGMYVCNVFVAGNKLTATHNVEVSEPPPTSHLPSIITFLVIIPVIILIASLVLYFLRLPPKILDIAGIDNLIHGKSANLSWMVSGFKPRNIEINAYLERGDQRRKIGSWKYPTPQDQNYDDVNHPKRGEGIELLGQEEIIQPLKPNFSFFSSNCLCPISITPDKRKDKGAELVIEVKHASLKTLLTKRQELNIKGDYFAAHITAPQCLKHGEEVTLTCDITKCDPEPLLITWLKEKQVIYKDGNIQDTRYTHTETRDVPHEGNVLKSSSSLKFRAKVKEDHGMKYTCKVSYNAIGKMLKPCYETLITAQPVVEQITSENVGQQMKLSCRVHSFHPKTIEIKWFKEKDELPTTDSELHIDDDGLYSASSILMYVPEKEDNGKTLRCQVDHTSLLNPEIREWKLEEQRTIGIKS